MVQTFLASLLMILFVGQNLAFGEALPPVGRHPDRHTQECCATAETSESSACCAQAASPFGSPAAKLCCQMCGCPRQAPESELATAPARTVEVSVPTTIGTAGLTPSHLPPGSKPGFPERQRIWISAHATPLYLHHSVWLI